MPGMDYILGICAIAAIVLGIVMFRDPDGMVRVWATIGFGVTVVGAYISVVSLGSMRQGAGQ